MTTCCGRRTENKPITPATVKQNHTWSGKKTEEHDGWNALECLRGRLLAERQASKVAKEQAESLCNKFNELEKKLKEEIKLRDKAERKLKLLKKKLECFNVSTPSLQKCHSGEKCELFCGSSLCSAALLENEVRNHNVAEEHALAHTHNSPFITKDGDSLLTDTSCCNSDLGNFLPQISGKTPNQSSDNLKNGENRLSLSRSKSLAKGYNSQGSYGYYGSNPSPAQASPEMISQNPNPRL
ncbi:uncharacterized protein LOC106756908 isoform X2 [Vigna radiata var. radiata]|uniref:Uncharacterized protein LOC106756908 isoform X2 n=1 Tax=Vigna radiata var. radiata TaxID=3916 RepID=A0A1S3TML8_VIGRR|nr:uncharacterized protein LOC106756908 isoform X2 [Vigna radiata var. radiata]